jgi:hypothetical protein
MYTHRVRDCLQFKSLLLVREKGKNEKRGRKALFPMWIVKKLKSDKGEVP